MLAGIDESGSVAPVDALVPCPAEGRLMLDHHHDLEERHGRLGYDDVEADRAAGGRLYHEFLRVPDLSAGLYVLEAGATDPQSPHTEDELYYVSSGRAPVTVGGETRAVVPGSLVFVAAGVPHRFHDIDERLELLVAFGPAEGARAATAG